MPPGSTTQRWRIRIQGKGSGQEGCRRGGGNRGGGGGRRERGATRETNLVAGGNQCGEPPGFVQHSPEFAFSVEQSSGHGTLSGGLVTLVVGGVDVPDVLLILELLVT